MKERVLRREDAFPPRRPPRPAVEPLAFAPLMLRVAEEPPRPLAAWVLRAFVALVVCVVVWTAVARLDVIAVTTGKLIPASHLKIVQPAEQGIVREILVSEGEAVVAGQVLLRMDAVLAEADLSATRSDRDYRRLALRRVDAELSGRPLARNADDPEEVYARVAAQYRANVAAYDNALAQERALLEKARHDLATAEQAREKLEQILPHYVEQEKAYGDLASEGFVGRITAADKARERIEREQDLRAQVHIIRSSAALITQQERKIVQIGAEYRRRLQAERVEIAAELEKTRQELAKHERRHDWLELRAPADGTVKDLATHTVGTVTSPGTILMTLVPRDEKLLAEVWIANEDVGFVREGQAAKVKVATYPFQKYGMLDGRVLRVSPDSSDAAGAGRGDSPSRSEKPGAALAYKAFVELAAQELAIEGRSYRTAPGMQVTAEIHLGTRTVLEYLLSPVQKAFHEAGRER